MCRLQREFLKSEETYLVLPNVFLCFFLYLKLFSIISQSIQVQFKALLLLLMHSMEELIKNISLSLNYYFRNRLFF
jgi:hypothetical protein